MSKQRTRSWIVLLALALGCAGTIDDNDVPLSPVSGPNQARIKQCANGRPPPAPAGLRILEIALYQTVKNRLYTNGGWQRASALDAPLIAGKRGLLRIFVARLKPKVPASYVPQTVRAVVTVRNGQDVVQYAEEGFMEGTSSEEDRESTLQIVLEGNVLREGTRLSVALQQEECEGRGNQASAYARLPPIGEQPLPFQAGGKLRVKVVPIQVEGGSAPDIDDREIENLEKALHAYYPVAEVEVTAKRDKLVVPRAPTARNENEEWEEVLHLLEARRKKDRVEGDVYYYGLFRAAESDQAYCAGASPCMRGLSWWPTSSASNTFTALGVWFPSDEETVAITAVHELGHLHGLGHTECAPEGETPTDVDRQYPFPGGATRWAGWDERSDELMDGSRPDVMGYCPEPWIGTYHYKLLASRTMPAPRATALSSVAGGGYRPLFVGDGGRARWGAGEPMERPPGGAVRGVVRDASGATLAEVDVVLRAVSHGTPVLYLPTLPAGWQTLALDDGRTFARAAIEPPTSRE